MNSTGQLIKSMEIGAGNSEPVDLSSFSDGVYFMALTNNREKVVKKVMKTAY